MKQKTTEQMTTEELAQWFDGMVELASSKVLKTHYEEIAKRLRAGAAAIAKLDDKAKLRDRKLSALRGEITKLRKQLGQTPNT